MKSSPERREAVAELAAEGFTQRETAAILGVDAATVNRDLNRSDPVANATEEPPTALPEQRKEASPVAFATGDETGSDEDEVEPELKSSPRPARCLGSGRHPGGLGGMPRAESVVARDLQRGSLAVLAPASTLALGESDTPVLAVMST